jgi:protein SCO1/2
MMRTTSSIVLAAVLALGGAACREPSTRPATTETHSAASVASTSTSTSIYPLDSALRDFDDAPIGVDVFRGHPVIISMFYGSCPAACPLLVTHIKQIEAGLPPAVRADVRVLLVSFDAERDTPAALRELAEAQRVDMTRWRFATASDDTVRPIANALGVHYRRGIDGAFSHNSVITVLDRDGRIVARTEDPRPDLVPLADAVVRSHQAAVAASAR